jgi:hypothetical protein
MYLLYISISDHFEIHVIAVTASKSRESYTLEACNIIDTLLAKNEAKIYEHDL